MKYFTTSKQLKNNTPANELKRVGYCGIQTLLQGHEPIAYNSGIYGWNYDVYCIYGLTITTGYRNMCGATMARANEYEQAAQDLYNMGLSWDERAKRKEELLKEFCILNGGRA